MSNRPTLDELYQSARPALLDRWTDPKNEIKGAPVRDLERLEMDLFIEVDELATASAAMKEWETADVAVYALIILAEMARRKNETLDH